MCIGTHRIVNAHAHMFLRTFIARRCDDEDYEKKRRGGGEEEDEVVVVEEESFHNGLEEEESRSRVCMCSCIIFHSSLS